MSADATQALLPVTLKPCPFCDGKATISGWEWFSAECDDCGAKMAARYKSKADAITAWNTRQSHSLPGDVGMLRDQIASALAFNAIHLDASLNLQGALDDLRGQFDPNDNGVIATTVERVIAQIEAVRAALTPSPCPGDVGTASASILEASWDIAFATFPESPDAFKAGVLAARIQGQFAALCDGMTRAEVHTHLDMVEAHDALAALTPSALSGDAGEG